MNLIPTYTCVRLASPFTDAASSIKPIQPKFSGPDAVPGHLEGHADAGMGRIVTLQQGKGMALDDIVGKVKALLGLSHGTSSAPSVSQPADRVPLLTS